MLSRHFNTDPSPVHFINDLDLVRIAAGHKHSDGVGLTRHGLTAFQVLTVR